MNEHDRPTPNDITAGTVPVRFESSARVAGPSILNGTTSLAVATLTTGWKLRLPGLGGAASRRTPLFDMQETAPATDTFVTLADPHLQDVLDRLISLSGLPRDWDGQGAEPIHETAVASAMAVLRALIDQARGVGFALPRPATSPSPGGSIGFEWERDGNVLTIECIPGSDVLHVYQSLGDTEREEDIANLPALWDTVRDFLRASA